MKKPHLRRLVAEGPAALRLDTWAGGALGVAKRYTWMATYDGCYGFGEKPQGALSDLKRRYGRGPMGLGEQL